MSLSAGTRFGPYEILSPLGAGGMGEVYRARDTRLGREVAVKIIPEALAGPQALERFEREARAVAQLSHPNILAIHDVGREGITAFAVMELLEGETLRQRLTHGALPVRKAVDLAAQIAEGLAAAHEKGIVHRDLKPENVFVTSNGRAKLLDFGLAREMAASREESGIQTETHGTDPGTVLGTARYMSPEQVRGQAVDHHSDIFSFGVVLYEMLTGKQAFRRETTAESMAAILKEEPPEIVESGAGPSPALQRIVHHCLEKKPGERFQSARDIAFALQSFSGSAAASQPSAAAPARRRHWKPAVAALVVAAGIAGGFLAGRRGVHSGPSGITRLTFRRGQVDAARFAPDGQTIVYSASWGGSPFEVFSTRADSTESRALGFPSSVLAGVSSSGEMALLRNAVPFNVGQPTSQTGMLARAPLAGGAPRDLAEGVQFADWSPDGRELAVVRFQDGKTRLEFPAGHVLYETGGLIANPRFSPRGDRIAFLDLSAPGDTRGGVSVVDLEGRRTVLVEGLKMTNGLAWAPGGDEVWFAGGRSDLAKELIAVSLSGKERVVYRSLTAIHLFDVGKAGRVLLGQEVRRRELWGRQAGAAEDRDLTWLDNSALNSGAFDGKSVVINEFGEGGGEDNGVYLRSMDGSAPIRIGGGFVFDLSADGRFVLTIARRGSPGQKLVLLPTGAGQPKELPTEPLTYVGGMFGPDGKKLILGAMKPGEAQRIYVQGVDGGGPKVAFTTGFVPVSTPSIISADGRFVVSDFAGHLFLQSLAGGDARPIHGLTPDDGVFGFTNDGRLFVGRASGARITLSRLNPDTGRREAWKEIAPADATGVWPIDGICLTPDGSAYVYNFARRLSDLYVVDGLK
jgi:Tol biopolymer transport system component